MGQTLGNMQNMGNIGEAKWSDLNANEKGTRVGVGALKGGMRGLATQQPAPQGMETPMQIPQTPQVDFSQLGKPKSNAFYGAF